jgi:hypothetical protein
MKSFKPALFAVTALLVSHAAIAAMPGEGTWIVTQRLCSYGQVAKDAFEMGRDSMELSIAGDVAQITTVVDGKRNVTAALADQLHEQLVAKNQDGTLEVIPYAISPYQGLVLSTSGFSDGGSCEKGQTLKTAFTKAN